MIIICRAFQSWCDVASFTTGVTFSRCAIYQEGKKYDPNGDYVRKWVPELQNIPKECIHEPWKMTELHQIEFQTQIGVDYPLPIVDPALAEARRAKRTEKRAIKKSMKILGRRGSQRTDAMEF
jgi:deoxyribodipyrimidine photo-lyase